jgi:mono/diheme cytochrome c family protein
MTREPVRHRPPANRLAFPFNIRAAIGIWKRLYFRAGPYRPDPAKSPAWNRGAYLAEGLGHCGSCHTPRNSLGAERKDRAYDGGEAEGWHAYAINERSGAAVPWTEDALLMYLRRGWHDRHGISRGPMAAVTGDLAEVREDDVRAIAAYFASRIGSPPAAGVREPIAGDPAMALYRHACHGCHDGSQSMPFGGLPLHLSIGVTGESPRNLVIVTMHGLPAADGEATPLMPGFAGALSDRQLVDLAAALRANLTDKPPWTDLEKIVREVRAAGPRLARHPAPAADPAGGSPSPAPGGAR